MLTKTIQFANGKEVEAFLDDYFRGEGFTIEPTTPHQERVLHLGDRKFIRGKMSFFVEYKSGIQTAYTGNIFLETISVDATNTPGWVFTCQTTFVLYACLLNNKILVFRPEKLRTEIDDLRQRFRETKTSKGQNSGYDTHGVLVPLEYAETHLAEMIFRLNPSN